MRHVCVITNLLDMWAEPIFNSERVNQLRFGETVAVGRKQNGYCRVTQPSGYQGWVDARFLRPITMAQMRAYEKKVNGIVVRSFARILDPAKQVTPPYFLYYGTPLAISSTVSGFARVRHPDSTLFLLKVGSVRPINWKGAERVSGAAIVAEARKFLGVPYLWGGISPAGFDCSGLVQTVWARFGVRLPRDTGEQVMVGKRILREHVQTGDLLFFERHVGLAIGRDRIIHASVGGGGVRINSLRPGTDDYRQDLDRDFRQARRIV